MLDDMLLLLNSSEIGFDSLPAGMLRQQTKPVRLEVENLDHPTGQVGPLLAGQFDAIQLGIKQPEAFDFFSSGNGERHEGGLRQGSRTTSSEAPVQVGHLRATLRDLEPVPTYGDAMLTETYVHEPNVSAEECPRPRMTYAGFRMERRARAGILPGCPPVGYRTRRYEEGGGAEVDLALAPLVREAFLLAATGEHSLRVLLRIMTDKGLVSRTGNAMGVSALWGMLTNHYYIGSVRWGGKFYKGQHEPLVDWRTFGLVQKRLGESKGTRACQPQEFP
jgi:hypothetical protein